MELFNVMNCIHRGHTLCLHVNKRNISAPGPAGHKAGSGTEPRAARAGTSIADTGLDAAHAAMLSENARQEPGNEIMS